jgi:hypothetical protein
MKQGPAVPAWLAAGLVGVILGGVGGFYYQTWTAKPTLAGPPSPGGGMRGGGGGPRGGGGPGGGGGFGGGQQHPNAMALVRTVGALDTLQKAQGKELTADQKAKLKPSLSALAGDQTLTEEQCQAKIDEVKAILSPDQQSLLEDMTARPGGRGGGGGGLGGPRGGGPGANSPAGGNSPAANTPAGATPGGGPGRMPNAPTPAPFPGGMGGGMGGAQPNLDKPFSEGRGKERLDSLLQSLGGA